MSDDLSDDRHEPGIDLVAAPVRYPRTPIVALLAIAVLPAVGLLTLHRWADREADVYEASQRELEAVRSATPTIPSTSLPVERPVGPGVFPPLDRPLLELRRAPDAVVERTNASLLGDSLALALPFYGPQSCAAVSVEGIPVAEHNPGLAVIPASAQKLIVAAVALEVLGPDFRFRTEVYGELVDGVIEGDLYLVGGGDPVLTADDFPIDADQYPAFNTTSLDTLAESVAAAGVTRVRGTVIGVGTRYDDEWFVDSWGDGVAFTSAGPYDALLVNDARVVGRTDVQDDPNFAAAREFARLLGNAGVSVNNGWGSGELSLDAALLATIESAPLAEILDEMLTTSDNNTAELLLKEIGLAVGGVGTRAAGLNAVDATLRQWGVPMDGVRIIDGSGLSPSNRLTCAALLAVVQRHTGGRLEQSVPIAAETGTLAEEFTESPIAGRLHAKTGTLGNPPFDADPPAAKALAGWVSTSTGATIEFVLLLNGDDITENRRFAPLWTAFADRLAAYPAGVVAADLLAD